MYILRICVNYAITSEQKTVPEIFMINQSKATILSPAEEFNYHSPYVFEVWCHARSDEYTS